MAEVKKKKLGPGRHLSAIKRDRQNEKRAAHNHHILSTVRSSIKKLIQAIDAGDKKQAPTLLNEAQSQIARAVKRNLYHAKTGSRKIARLSRRVSQLS